VVQVLLASEPEQQGDLRSLRAKEGLTPGTRVMYPEPDNEGKLMMEEKKRELPPRKQAELYRRALRKQRKQNAVRSFAILSLVVIVCIVTWHLEGHHG
jgi:hypothetical protein